MYVIIIASCLLVALRLYWKDPRSIVPGALVIIAVQTLLFGFDNYFLKDSGAVFAGANRVIWLLLYTAGPLFSAAILFIYSATILPAETFNKSHKITLVAGIASVALAVYHFVYFSLDIPRTMFDLGMEILAALSSFIAFMYMAYLCSTRMYFASKKNRHPYNIILVPGHRLDGDKMSPILVARLDTALECWRRDGETATFLLSGGKCFAATVPEAEVMRDYLVSQGVPEEKLLIERRSRTTLQNMQYSKELMDRLHLEPRCLVVTGEFHVMRVLILAASQGIDAQGIGSRTPRSPLLIGLTTREMLAFFFRHKVSLLLFAEAVLFFEAWRYVQVSPTILF